MRRNRPHTPDSFRELLRPRGDCLEYQGVRNRAGYGHIHYQGQFWQTHRLAWTLANGPIPDGLQVRHRCDNPPCCNPAHLLLGTHQENVRDAMARGRGPLRARVGEANPAAKLTVAEVQQIRSLAAAGIPRRVIGRRFGIAHQSVTKIVLRRKWASVA